MVGVRTLPAQDEAAHVGRFRREPGLDGVVGPLRLADDERATRIRGRRQVRLLPEPAVADRPPRRRGEHAVIVHGPGAQPRFDADAVGSSTTSSVSRSATSNPPVAGPGSAAFDPPAVENRGLPEERGDTHAMGRSSTDAHEPRCARRRRDLDRSGPVRPFEAHLHAPPVQRLAGAHQQPRSPVVVDQGHHVHRGGRLVGRRPEDTPARSRYARSSASSIGSSASVSPTAAPAARASDARSATGAATTRPAWLVRWCCTSTKAEVVKSKRYATGATGRRSST